MGRISVSFVLLCAVPVRDRFLKRDKGRQNWNLELWLVDCG